MTEKNIPSAPLLPKEQANHYLPLFLRYVDVLGYNIHPVNILPLCFLKALEQVVYASSKAHSRDRLQADCQIYLERCGVDITELKHRIGTISSDTAVESARRVAKWLESSVGRILLVVDEVETARELPQDEIPEGMDEDDLKDKVKRDHIDILAQGCKEIANENVTPGVDYLFLASDPSYSSFGSGALQSARITTLDFQPVTFDQIDILRDAYKEFNVTFPEHLEEAAFFVANRNFRWYNWLMFRLYASHQNQPAIAHWELLGREAKNISGTNEIFNLSELETFLTGNTDVDGKLKRIVFAMLPTPESAVDLATRTVIENQRAVSRLAGVKLFASELASELRSRSFSGITGNRWERSGVTVEVTTLLSAFQLFGGVGGEFFFYKDSKEFKHQVMLLYPEIDDPLICRDLHQIFLGRHGEQSGSEAFGPSLELLAQLNRKWKPQRDSAFLGSPNKNTLLQEAREKHLPSTAQRQHLASGMANLVFEERWKLMEKVGREQIKLGSGVLADITELSMTNTTQSAWRVSPFHAVPVLVSDADTTALTRDLRAIRAKVGLAPVILLVVDRERYEQLEREDKSFHEGEIYPRELLIEIDIAQASADYDICLNFGYARAINFRLDDLTPGRWTHRSRSLKKKVQEEWDKRLKTVSTFGWVIHPVFPKTGKSADKLVAYVEAVVRGESNDDIQRKDSEMLGSKKEYDDAREHLEPIFDEQDQLALTPSHLHILRHLRDETDISQASPLLREVLYQGYLRISALDALKQNLEYLRARGIIRLNEDTQKYKLETPTELKASLEEGERTIMEYKAQRDELKSFFGGTLNSFHMLDTHIDPLLGQLEEHRKTLKSNYQRAMDSWNPKIFEEYTAFCSACRKTLTQISDPSAERAYPNISVEIIEESLPKLTSGILALEGNVAHRVRFLTQYQKEYEQKRQTVLSEAGRRQREIAETQSVAHPAFPWQVVESLIEKMIADLEWTSSKEGFSLSFPELEEHDPYPSFPLRILITENRLKESYARLVKYQEHLFTSTEGLWKHIIILATKWEKEVKLIARRVLNRWQELDEYLKDAGSDRRFIEEREEDYEKIDAALSCLPLRVGAIGLAGISEALETLQREALKLEEDIKAERERLDGDLLDGIPDLKGIRTLRKLVDRASSRGISATIEAPESIAQQKHMAYKDKKARISDLVKRLDAQGRELACRFPGASPEDWDIYKKVVSSLYQEKRDHGYSFEVELADGVVDERKINRLHELGMLSAEKTWKITP